MAVELIDDPNAQLVENLVEAENAGDIDRMFSVVSPEAAFRRGRKRARGRDALRAAAAEFYDAFPDHHRKIRHLFADGNDVVLLWRIAGTHTGVWQGLEPTGARIEIDGCTVWGIRGLRVVSSETYYDRGALLAQLGVTASPAVLVPS
jgi:steroid delta-isomerase-like uncharacterized protein